MKAQVFTIEALAALLIAASFVALQPAPPAADYGSLYRYQLAQDFLEITMKSQGNLESAVAFSNGDAAAKAKLEEKYSRILSSLGDYCLEMEARGNEMRANCGGRGRKIWVSGSRIVFDGTRFFELSLRLGFDA